MKISKDVFVILQYFIEQYIVSILKDANAAAIHTGRVKLMLSDIEFICNIRGLSTVCLSQVEKEDDVEVEEDVEEQVEVEVVEEQVEEENEGVEVEEENEDSNDELVDE